MTTTTKNVPIYFPQRKKRKRYGARGDTKMNEVKLALRLVEEYGLEHRDALEVVLEADVDKAASKMAKAATDDKDKQKELEGIFKKNMEKMLKAGDTVAVDAKDKKKDMEQDDEKDKKDKEMEGKKRGRK